MKASTCLHVSVGALLLALSISAAAENAITTGSVSVRAGPDNSYPEVAYLDPDTPIQVMGCLDDWSWCDVAFEDNRGWLYAPLITYEYKGGYVPFYSYAPALGVPIVAFSIDSYWGSYYHDRSWYAQREEWISRGPPHHERPQGPPPGAGPPPRQAVADRPRPETRSDRPLRLGGAEPPHQDVERHDGAGAPGGARQPERRSEGRPEERSPAAIPPAPATTPRVETHPNPAERAMPQRDEEGSRPAQHASPQRHEERPTEPPPHKDKDERRDHQRGDHPGDNHE
jgi:uncharacterized protein YraI